MRDDADQRLSNALNHIHENKVKIQDFLTSRDFGTAKAIDRFINELLITPRTIFINYLQTWVTDDQGNGIINDLIYFVNNITGFGDSYAARNLPGDCNLELTKLWEKCGPTLLSFVSSAQQCENTSYSLREVRHTINEQALRVEALATEVANQAESISTIHNNIKEELSKFTAKGPELAALWQATYLKDELKCHNREKWQWLIVMLFTLTLLATFIVILAIQPEWLSKPPRSSDFSGKPSSPDVIMIFITSFWWRFITVIGLSSIIIWASRHFRVTRHICLITRDRIQAISSFHIIQQFVLSDSSIPLSAFYAEAARAIFAPRVTGLEGKHADMAIPVAVSTDYAKVAAG